MANTASNGISGVAVAITLAGAVLAYSGIKGKGIASSIQALLAGNSPATAAQANPIGTGDAASQTAVAGSSDSATPEDGTGNAAIIANFLASKGLRPAAIAGILGNFKIESGLSPTSQNPNEGAIGLAQWEGGRRARLQAFAASQGTTETDLNTQLNFFWNELNSSYPTALNALRLTNDPAQAATIVDAQYEISSGSARQARIDAAQGYYTTVGGQ